MNKISQYILETEKEFENIIKQDKHLRKVIGVQHNCKCSFEEIKNLLKSRQLGLIELVKGLVPEEKPKVYSALIDREITVSDGDDGFNSCREQMIKNLELKEK